ncbi:MAG: M13 family metallopeptidase N-terminal domain-containing protein [Bacteroidota bacterium]
MRSKSFYLAAILTLFITACETKKDSEPLKKDVLAANIDSTINPGADIFQYANGGWIKNNPIPGEQSSWGIGNLVIEENLKRLKEIADKSATSGAAKGTPEQKIGDFWAMAMDSTKIEADGLKPVQPWLDKVNAITDVKSL